MFLGHADVMQGRHYEGTLEKFLQVVRTFHNEELQCILLSPFPDTHNNMSLVHRLALQRQYVEHRLLRRQGSLSVEWQSGLSLRVVGDPISLQMAV